jgi:hypothetical protein
MRLVVRKVFLLGLSVFLIGANVPAQAGNDTSWIPTDVNYSEPTVHSFAFTDKLALPYQVSVLQASGVDGPSVCKSTSDPACASKDNFQFTSILKVCASATDGDCISELSGIDGNGVSTKAKFTKYTVTNHINAFPADTNAGIPEGSTPSIWSIPSAPHASGSDYAVFAGITGNAQRNGSTWQSNAANGFMQLALIPVVLKDFGKGSQSKAGGWSQSIDGIYYDYCANSADGKQYIDCAHVNGSACIFPTNDQGMCYAEEGFGAVQKFNVQLKLSKEPTAWMHGRMVDPTIDIKPTGNGGVNLSVTAGATSVPMVYQTSPWKDLSTTMKNLWVKCNSNPQSCGEYWLARAPGATSNYIESSKTLVGNEDINMIRYINPFGKLPLEIMSTIAPLVGDKSVQLSSTWSMRTLSSTEMNGANKCFTGSPGLKGIVTTNSTAYSAGPPEFKDGYLNYQVASPHFNPDGKTPFKGNYNLVMRSDVARCLYGFSSAPISAVISVLSSEGANDVATTVTGEKNGWLSLSANNFQFSSPTIQVKLTQSASVKQSTITCVTGKISKKITAINPTCPKGFKKR